MVFFDQPPPPEIPEGVLNAMSAARGAGLTGHAATVSPAGGIPVVGFWLSPHLPHPTMRRMSLQVLEEGFRRTHRVLIDWPIRKFRRKVLKVKMPYPHVSSQSSQSGSSQPSQQQGTAGGGGGTGGGG